MTPTQARDCVPLAVSAGCVKAIDQALKRCGPDDFPLSTDEFREVITWQVLREHGQRMDKTEYLYNNASSFTVPPLSPSDEERARLNVVTFDGSDYALNRKLFDQLYEAHKRATIARHEAKAKKKAAGKTKGAKTSPAEAKRDEKRKHDELQARVSHLKREWLLDQVAAAIAGTKDLAVLARLAFAVHRFTELDNVADRLRYDGLARWQTSAGKRPAELAKWFAEWLAGFLAGEKSEARNNLLAELVRYFKIDEEAAWRRGKLGDRTEKFYSVHNGEQLVALGNELGLYLAPSKPKRVHLQVMLGQTKALPYPSILKRAQLV
jgi:hypothetical protein